jgi:tripartite-type tricarboxylate transporter receptor subunit TctC
MPTANGQNSNVKARPPAGETLNNNAPGRGNMPERASMKVSRRRIHGMALGAAALPFVTATAWGEAYPTHPVRLIVGFPAGSGPDIVGRIVAQTVGEKLGQSVVVENRPGAGSNLATADVAHAPPDGYMLMLLTTANVINATLYKNLSYDLLRDIVPVASIDNEPFVFEVTPSFPAKTLPEFIAYAKANPGKVTMASAGVGSAPHIFGEMFQRMAGIALTHVPFRGNPLPDVISGQVDFFIGPVQSALEFVRTDKLRALAMTTTTRFSGLPDVPVVADFVPGYEASGWLGIGAPKGTPAEVIERLNKTVNETIVDPAVKARLNSLGDTVAPRTSADFGLLMKSDVEKWAKVIQSANIKLEQ